MSNPEWHPIPLDFELRGTPVAFGPRGHEVTITGVERDDYGVHINYEVLPPLPLAAHGPRGEGDDDKGHEYEDRGGAFGLLGDRTDGVLTMPLPVEGASVLHVRITWSPDLESPSQDATYELNIRL